MSSVSIASVVKRYGPHVALKGIDLSVESGAFLVLLGPSGCGKSTLLNLIAGLDTISDGTISIDGDVVNDVRAKDRNIAMVFQSYALYPSMTVRRNISFGLEMRGVSRADRNAAAERAAEMLHITHLLDRKPSQLSGGQRQRVAMGRALVRQPKVFLFDEPLSNLDAQLRTDMRTEIKRLHHRLRTTVIYVTHDQIEAMTMATHIAVMRDGEVVQFGSPAEIYDQPATIFVAKFVGSPPMNFMSGRVVSDSGRVYVDLNAASHGRDPDLVIPLGDAGTISESIVGREVKVGIRPECIAVESGGRNQGPSRWMVQRQVDVVEPTGADTLAIFDVLGSEVIARVRAKEIQQPGQVVTFSVPLDSIHLFDPASERRIDIGPSIVSRLEEVRAAQNSGLSKQQR